MSAHPSFTIEGLAGEKKLAGSVKIQGAKNAALKAFAAAILFDEAVELDNVPETDDIQTIISILEKLGAKIEKTAKHSWKVDASKVHSTDIDEKLAAKMRASVVLTGPLLARFNKVSFPMPGGCVIGARPIDLFLNGYEKMGAGVKQDEQAYHLESHGLSGAHISFKKISVGATETLMMAAVLAKGTTVLENCALEPEIVSVAEWLNACGADIRGVGTPRIEIVGRNGKLLSAKKAYETIPDRIEAGSFLILGALCAKDLVIEDCEPKHMETVIDLLKDCGAPITVKKDLLVISGNAAPSSLLAPIVELRTREYPGFPTDLQAPMTVFLTQTNGTSKVVETIYEGRFKYIEDLIATGANIQVVNPSEVIVKGPTPLKHLPEGKELTAHDIRAGFAMVLTALIGRGKFTVTNVQLIDRGYEKLEERLRALGAKIERM